MHRPLIIAALLWTGMMCTALRAASVDEQVTELAKEAIAFLTEKKASKVAIGDFSAPPKHADVKARFMERLAQEFTKAKFEVTNDAVFVVQGRLKLATTPGAIDPTAKLIALRLEAEIADDKGAELLKLFAKADAPRDVHDEAEIGLVLGLSVDLDGLAKEKERNDSLERAANRPHVHLSKDGFTAFAAQDPTDDSLGVQILGVAKEQAPTLLKLTREGTHPFVPLDQGNEYIVRVVNNTPHEMAVALEIDGVSMFQFSKASPQPRFVLIAPKSTVDLAGWHLEEKQFAGFLVTLPQDSAAAKLGHQAKSGTISLAFARAWKEGEAAPADEPEGTRGAGTGFGAPIDIKVEFVKRHIGAIRRTLTLRYSK